MTATELAKKPEVFQSYTSSRQSTRMITPEGLRFSFVNFQLITKDESIIAYLDDEIKKGLASAGITKGKPMTSAEANPMEALKEKLREELKAEMAEEAKNEALGISKDMGSTKPATDAMPLGSLSTKGVATGKKMPATTAAK